MYNLTTKLPLDEELIRCPNLAERMEEEDLKNLGRCVVNDFDRDKGSRAEWERKMDLALKLTMQVTEEKTFPWQGAANVKFPLITIAAIQYSSRAYPALVSGPNPVSCAPIFPRPTPRIPPQLQQAAQQDDKAKQMLQQMVQQAQQALMQWKALSDKSTRIARHMSFQILEEDVDWEENQDRALLIQSIMGCVFKKTFFDAIAGCNKSECVNPRELVVSYFTKNLDSCPRYTHILYLTKNECYEREARGLFCPFTEGSDPNPQPRLLTLDQQVANQRQGVTQYPADSSAPIECLEQYRYIDLDGDGYAEPYVVTVRYDNAQVLRVVARFTRKDVTFSANGKVLRIHPIQAFTKYPFIPSPDGGFYDLGFGALLGPLNETIDSAVNQLLDAGTLANAGGGFLGRGFRNKKGEYRFRPGEWKTVDSTGDDLHKNILPLPTPQPSTVLFQLISLLIEYSESIAGAADILQGKNPGQNTPAETSRAMVEQGMKVFNGIYKRTHRAFTQELRKLFRLNTIYCTGDANYLGGYQSPWAKVMAKDYQSTDVLLIKPSADPAYMSDAQRYNQALSLREAASSVPGYNQYEVQHYFLEALKIADPERFYPDPTGPFAVPPPVNPKVQVEQMKQQTKQQGDANTYKVKLLELAQKRDLIDAQIQELQARAAQEKAQADGVDKGHQIALLDAQIAAKKNHMDSVVDMIKTLHELNTSKETDGEGTSQGMASSPSNAGISQQMPAAPGQPPNPMGGGSLPIR